MLARAYLDLVAREQRAVGLLRKLLFYVIAPESAAEIRAFLAERGEG